MEYKITIEGNVIKHISEPYFNEDRMLAHDFLLLVGSELCGTDKILNDKNELKLTRLLDESEAEFIFDFMIKILKKAKRIREKELSGKLKESEGK